MLEFHVQTFATDGQTGRKQCLAQKGVGGGWEDIIKYIHVEMYKPMQT